MKRSPTRVWVAVLLALALLADATILPVPAISIEQPEASHHPQPHHDYKKEPWLVAPNIVIGAAFAAVQRGWFYLLEPFLQSLVTQVPDVHIVLMADGDTLEMLAPWIAREVLPGHFHPITMGGLEAAAPRVWRKFYINKARYFGYQLALDVVRRIIDNAAGTGPLPSPALLLNGCRDWSAAPLVLLADTRDIVFQRDPFRSARSHIAQWQSDPTGNATTAVVKACKRAPLLVVAEPSLYALGSDPKNDANQRDVFRPAADALWAGDVPLCSGTTMGAAPAMEAYIRTMVATMPLAAPGASGTDQALHNALIAVTKRLGSGELRWKANNEASRVGGDGAPVAGGDAAADALSRGDGGGDGGGSLLLDAPRQGALLSLGREDAYSRLFDAASRLAASADVIVRPHESGWFCTLALFSLEHCAHFVETRAYGEGGAGAGANGNSGVLEIAPAVGSPPCDVVHQYDREALHFLTAPLALDAATAARRAAVAAGAAGSPRSSGASPVGVSAATGGDDGSSSGGSDGASSGGSPTPLLRASPEPPQLTWSWRWSVPPPGETVPGARETAPTAAGVKSSSLVPPLHGEVTPSSGSCGPQSGDLVVGVSPVACNQNFFSKKFEDCYRLEAVAQLGPGPMGALRGCSSAVLNATTSVMAPATGAEAGCSAGDDGVQGALPQLQVTRIVWVDARSVHPVEQCALPREITTARRESATRRQ